MFWIVLACIWSLFLFVFVRIAGMNERQRVYEAQVVWTRARFEKAVRWERLRKYSRDLVANPGEAVRFEIQQGRMLGKHGRA